MFFFKKKGKVPLNWFLTDCHPQLKKKKKPLLKSDILPPPPGLYSTFLWYLMLLDRSLLLETQHVFGLLSFGLEYEISGSLPESQPKCLNCAFTVGAQSKPPCSCIPLYHFKTIISSPPHPTSWLNVCFIFLKTGKELITKRLNRHGKEYMQMAKDMKTCLTSSGIR